MENKSAFCNLYRCIAIELKDELEAARTQLDTLAYLKDILEQKLVVIQSQTDVETIPLKKKKKWYTWLWPFGKKNPHNNLQVSVIIIF